MAAETGEARYAEIPAFVRAPKDLAAALAEVVEENEVRADVSPWERGRFAVIARNQEVFATVEEAVDRLHPTGSRMKRSRVRALARLVEALGEALGEVLAAPERLSEARALRLAAAVHRRHGPMLAAVLAESRDPGQAGRALVPVLAEVERDPEEAGPLARPRRERRRRVAAAPLAIRREAGRDGCALRFVGPEATEGLMDAAVVEIARLMGPAD